MDGYFDPLLEFMNRAVGQGFLLPQHLKMFTLSVDPARILNFMEGYRPPLILDAIWGLNPDDLKNSEEKD